MFKFVKVATLALAFVAGMTTVLQYQEIPKYKRQKDTQSKVLDWVSFCYYSKLSNSNAAAFDYRCISRAIYLIYK